MRFMLATTLFLTASNAQAICFEGSGFDFAEQVNNRLQYLVCLHNEQNDRMNEHADIINAQNTTINDLQGRLQQAESVVADLMTKVDDMERSQRAATTTIEDLTSRLDELERARPQ